jgi:hypothetical protein
VALVDSGWCSMKRKRGGPTPPEPWEDPWTGYWWHSRPVARSLGILEKLDVLVHESGRTDKNARAALYPFYVVVKVTPLTPCPYTHDSAGEPVVKLPGDHFYIGTRKELHAVAAEALRRSQEAKAEEEP